MARWSHNTNYRPGTAPRGYVEGLPAALEIIRRELATVEVTRDSLGNPWPVPPANRLPEALLKVERAGLMPALRDYLDEECPGVDHETALLTLVGDPTVSDADEWGGPPSGIKVFTS